MSSGTDQTISAMSEDWRTTPFCLSVIARAGRDGRSRDAGAIAETGALVLDVLAERPGPLLGAFGKLQIAPRHVEAAGIAEDGARARRAAAIRNAGAPMRDDEFDLEVIVAWCPADRGWSRRLAQRRRALGEIERLFAVDGDGPSPWRGPRNCGRRRRCARPDSAARRRGWAATGIGRRARTDRASWRKTFRSRFAPGTHNTSSAPRSLA